MLTLEELCVQLLIKYKDYIGDIGQIPLHILYPVLQKCSAEDLSRIEAETRNGGRLLPTSELNQHWRRIFVEEFGSSSGSAQERPIPANTGASSSRNAGQKPGAEDWKTAYWAKQREIEEKKARVGAKVRKMWEEERKRKESRSIQVINALPRKRKLPATSSHRFGSPGSKPTGSRERLAKKLRINPVKRSPMLHLRSTPQPAKPTGPTTAPNLVDHDIDWGMKAAPTSRRPAAVDAHDDGTFRQRERDSELRAMCGAVKLMEVEIDWDKR